MTSTFTSNKSYELQGTGDNTNSWGTVLNTNVFTVVDTNLGGRLNIDVSGNSDITITSSQAQNISHNLTGTLTGNINYIFPSKGGFFFISNQTSGAFTVTVKPSGGTGIVIPQGSKMPVFINPDSGTASVVLDTFSNLTVTGTVTTVNATVSGTLTASGAFSAGNVGVTSATLPADGLYRPSVNNVGIAARSLLSANFTNPSSAVNYFNFTGSATGNAITVSALGSDTNIDVTLTPKGTGKVNLPGINVTGSNIPAAGAYLSGTNTLGLSARSLLAMTVTNPASAVNYLTVSGSATGNPAIVSVDGSDSNVGITLQTKGTGGFLLNTTVTQLSVPHTASAVNYFQLTGSVTTADLSLTAAGSDTNIGITLAPKGTGTVKVPTAAADTNTTQAASTAFVLNQAASASEVLAGTSTTKFVTPAVQQKHKSAAKVLLNYNGSTQSVRSSYNVSSVTRSSTGQYTVNFTTSFSSANYYPVANVWNNLANVLDWRSQTLASGSYFLGIRNETNSFVDPEFLIVTIHGDQ